MSASRSVFSKPVGGLVVKSQGGAATAAPPSKTTGLQVKKPLEAPGSQQPQAKKSLAPQLPNNVDVIKDPLPKLSTPSCSATLANVKKSDASPIESTRSSASPIGSSTITARAPAPKLSPPAPKVIPAAVATPRQKTVSKPLASASIAAGNPGIPPTVQWVPAATPFPSELSLDTVNVIGGRRMERPYTTNMGKEFPTRGQYCCIRCRTPIVAAVHKVPIDPGVSAFQKFNTSACLVSVHMSDEYSTLVVLCKKCNGFMGVLTQEIPPSCAAVCVSGEMFKVNSCCLHFVDETADLTTLSGNYFTKKAKQKSTVPAKRNSNDIEEALDFDGNSDDDVMDDLIEGDDFSMDVIGTTDGADRVIANRRALNAMWRSNTPKLVSAPPANNNKPSSPSSLMNRITAAQRHSMAMEALGDHSDESVSSESDDSDDDDEDDEG